MVPLVVMSGIHKRYGPVVANDGVDLELHAGTVHSVVGENGAGKSTLMNILYGLTPADSGRIEVKGQPVAFKGPQDAIALRIGMVHQHFMLVPTLTVAENVVLGGTPTTRGLIDTRRARSAVREVGERYGLDIDPDERVQDLPVGLQQRVEIVKALFRGADVLILDEPTAVLTPQEAVELGRVMRQLTDDGKAVVFISHKLKEVMSVSDQITVMRRGRVSGQFAAAATTETELARHMIGRDVLVRVNKDPADPGAPILTVTDLHARDDRGHMSVRGVDLVLRAGSIVGVAGVEGNGQSELVETIAGLRPTASGKVQMHGDDITHASPRRRRERGLAHIPEDRLKRGVAASRSIAENLVACSYTARQFTRAGLVRTAAVRRYAAELIDRFGIAAAHQDLPVRSLSGGNMQKVVVARELAQSPAVLLIAQPTRGVDIGAIENIHRQIVALRDSGSAILLVSAELDEVMSLADELVVMYEGRLVARLDPADTDENEVGLFMAGVGAEDPAASPRARAES